MLTETTSDRTHLLKWMEWDGSASGSEPVRGDGQIAIVGLPGAGQAALYNSLYGWEGLSSDGEAVRDLGLFTVMELSDSRYEAAAMLYRLERAQLILFIISAASALEPANYHWLARLRALDARLVIALATTGDSSSTVDSLLATVQQRAARPVIPVALDDAEAVYQQFLPAVLRSCPEVATRLAGEIARLRCRVVRQIALDTAASIMEQATTGDLPAERLAALQMTMLRRITALYGHGMSRGFAPVIHALAPIFFRFLPELAALVPKRYARISTSAVLAGSAVLIGEIALHLCEQNIGQRLTGLRRSRRCHAS